jgi:hypothetical protein
MQYAELKPVPCITYADAFALREKCATPILKQVICVLSMMWALGCLFSIIFSCKVKLGYIISNLLKAELPT